MAYSDKVIDHYEHPRNVGSFGKDEAGVAHLRGHLLDACLVLWVGRGDEEVVGGLQMRCQRTEALGIAICQLVGLDAERVGRVGDRLAVLVGAGQKEDVLAALAHVPREHVDGDRCIGVAEVRLGVDVEDWRGYVEAHRPEREGYPAPAAPHTRVGLRPTRAQQDCAADPGAPANERIIRAPVCRA